MKGGKNSRATWKSKAVLDTVREFGKEGRQKLEAPTASDALDGEGDLGSTKNRDLVPPFQDDAVSSSSRFGLRFQKE